MQNACTRELDDHRERMIPRAVPYPAVARELLYKLGTSDHACEVTAHKIHRERGKKKEKNGRNNTTKVADLMLY